MHRDVTAAQRSSHCCFSARVRRCHAMSRCRAAGEGVQLQAASMSADPSQVADSWVSLLVCGSDSCTVKKGKNSAWLLDLRDLKHATTLER